MSVSVAQRAIGAIVGCLAADAACTPVHWIYDIDKLKGILAQYPNPEFIPKSYCPFYTIPTGRNSCYGHQSGVLLECMSEFPEFNREDYKQRLLKNFGNGTDYDIEAKLGRPYTREDLPIEAPWRNGSIKAFLQNMADGKDKTGKPDDAQADGFSKVAPVVARYAGDPKLLQYVEDVVRVTQDDNEAVKAALAGALILEQYILHGNVQDVIEKIRPKLGNDVLANLRKALDVLDKPHDEVVKTFGLSCGLPHSFQNSVHCVMSSDGNFVNTVRKSITAGGDNCSRTGFVGACLGAIEGVSGIPQEWLAKMSNKDVVCQAEKVVAFRN